MNTRYSNTRSSGSVHFLAFNPYTVAAGLTPQQVEAGIRRGRLERARMAARLATTAWRALRGASTAVGNSIAEGQRRRAARLRLMNLDRHLLDDIGLRPDQVREAVDGPFTAPEADLRRADVRPIAPAQPSPAARAQQRAA